MLTFHRGSVDRLRIHVLPSKRFKTFAISLYAGIPLAEEKITPTALLPFVLRRGTAATPETIAFRERLDDLYGAGFGFDLYKRSDAQIIQFRLDMINDSFVAADQSLLAAAIKLLGEVATAPALENGVFRTKYVEAEKDTARKRLEAIINDKIRYAAERCVEEMCAGEPYRLSALGKISELPAIDAANLYAAYQQWLDEAVFDLYVVGDTTYEEVAQLAAAAFPGIGRLSEGKYPVPAISNKVGEVKTVVEELDVNQGKLNMGLRSTIGYADSSYAAMLMYNGILGGYSHSKLFRNVREKESLAYYASSRYDGHKGLLTIQSGIEFENYNKATDIIQQQLQSMRQGDLSELELNQTKAMITNQLKEIQDSAFEMIGFDFNAVLSGRSRTLEELSAEIKAITPADIVRVANQVELDTIYFLRNRKEG